jgi:hypothetical protein
VIAHLGVLPLEEVLPVLAGAGSGLLAVRAWVLSRLRRDVTMVCVSGEGEWWRRHDEDGSCHG